MVAGSCLLAPFSSTLRSASSRHRTLGNRGRSSMARAAALRQRTCRWTHSFSAARVCARWTQASAASTTSPFCNPCRAWRAVAFCHSGRPMETAQKKEKKSRIRSSATVVVAGIEAAPPPHRLCRRSTCSAHCATPPPRPSRPSTRSRLRSAPAPLFSPLARATGSASARRPSAWAAPPTARWSPIASCQGESLSARAGGRESTSASARRLARPPPTRARRHLLQRGCARGDCDLSKSRGERCRRPSAGAAGLRHGLGGGVAGL
mmetsp:Transcript_2131/g.6240  ORF Transcript_2131/g.6240 Transcript_2131/m.6240 type:complete len:264 (+) Transcript_2131:728-1519(+)